MGEGREWDDIWSMRVGGSLGEWKMTMSDKLCGEEGYVGKSFLKGRSITFLRSAT